MFELQTGLCMLLFVCCLNKMIIFTSIMDFDPFSREQFEMHRVS